MCTVLPRPDVILTFKPWLDMACVVWPYTGRGYGKDVAETDVLAIVAAMFQQSRSETSIVDADMWLSNYRTMSNLVHQVDWLGSWTTDIMQSNGSSPSTREAGRTYKSNRKCSISLVIGFNILIFAHQRREQPLFGSSFTTAFDHAPIILLGCYGTPRFSGSRWLFGLAQPTIQANLPESSAFPS